MQRDTVYIVADSCRTLGVWPRTRIVTRHVEAGDGGPFRRRIRVTHPMKEQDMRSMKGTMFAAVALVALAACSKEKAP
ncbi:MAG TPA: hypothetical protein P5319_04535, partial [Gemmatimonadales bacterium]|nr:hypothetical protein [Gemmatimonadales bacterium]